MARRGVEGNPHEADKPVGETGIFLIGNVPKWDPPKRKQKFKMLKNGDLQVIVNDPNEKKDDEKNEKEELASDEDVDASAPEKYLDE